MASVASAIRQQSTKETPNATITRERFCTATLERSVMAARTSVALEERRPAREPLLLAARSNQATSLRRKAEGQAREGKRGEVS